eukprot:TRINITY_DN13865_c1_g1_i1.p1 TRINITY_DN13865_c1_g1~~TRINITY_DN13865_c1_g1_i1.p1  ORF type:complete len:209 (-),score=9.66 TRINITY_DN13865_c1_g1_i1:210-803(-)
MQAGLTITSKIFTFAAKISSRTNFTRIIQGGFKSTGKNLLLLEIQQKRTIYWNLLQTIVRLKILFKRMLGVGDLMIMTMMRKLGQMKGYQILLLLVPLTKMHLRIPNVSMNRCKDAGIVWDQSLLILVPLPKIPQRIPNTSRKQEEDRGLVEDAGMVVQLHFYSQLDRSASKRKDKNKQKNQNKKIKQSSSQRGVQR